MFIMGNTRREFTPEFKDEAVKLVINTSRPVSTVARELGIKEATLGRWVNLFKASQDAGEGGVTETEKAELLRLRKENADQKLDRAFPKKPPSSSPRKPRIRTPSVHTNAGGEDQLQHRPHGTPPRRVPVGLLRLAGPQPV
ncbi:transposase [Cryobacterium sp. Sr3]|nr:transposase [Cryobacterium sp. Sr3]